MTQKQQEKINKLRRETKNLKSLLRRIRIDIRALRNRLENSTDRVLLSSRIDMIGEALNLLS